MAAGSQIVPPIEVSRDYHLGIDLALFALPPVREKPMSDEKLRALPKDVPDYHARQAAHLRALAENATTARLKARLMDEAEQHDRLAAAADEPQ